MHFHPTQLHRLLSVALLATGMLTLAFPASATEQSKQRQQGRDVRQDARPDARQEKADCRQANEKNNAECRQDKRNTKQDARGQARDIKY